MACRRPCPIQSGAQTRLGTRAKSSDAVRMFAPRFSLLALAAVLLSSCFALDRLNGVEPGEIDGTTIRLEGGPAVDAAIAVKGTTRLVRSGADGAFRIRGLQGATWALKLSTDADNDGIDERSAFRAVSTSNSTSAPLSVLLGDVVLLGTGTLTGVVVVGDEATATAASNRSSFGVCRMSRRVCS